MADVTKKPSRLTSSRRQKTRTNSRRGQNPVTQRELKGGSIDVPSNPPNVSYQPWNNLTIVHSGTTGELTITVDDLCYELAKQIDPIMTGLSYTKTNQTGSKLSSIINMKLQKIRAWNITGQMIALSVDDFSDSAKAIADVDALCGLVDTGSSTHTPAVGYDLPASHRSIVLRNGSAASDSKSVLYHVMAPSTDTIIVYTTVLWKFDGPSKFSSFETVMMQTIREISESAKNASTSVSHVEALVTDIQKQQSKLGIGNFLANGIEIAAPYVLPAVGAIEEKLDSIKAELVKLNLAEIPNDTLLKDWIVNVSSNASDA